MSARAEVVAITGASADVGRAAAREFARHGARIGLLARGIDGLKAARKEVEELGSEALVIPTDLADADQVESAAAQIEAEFGHIDIWINNAMTSVFSPIKEMTAAEFLVQLPALNTPQFGWVKSRLSRKAQPVPPIFQPEVPRKPFTSLPTIRAVNFMWPAVSQSDRRKQNCAGLARSLPRSHRLRFAATGRRRRSKSPRQLMATGARRPWRARRVRCPRPHLESAIVDKRTPHFGRVGCGRARRLWPYRGFEKENL